MSNIPVLGEGVTVTKRTLNVFFVLDHSQSMSDDGRIGALNTAIPSTVEALKGIEAANPNLRIKIKVIKFSDTADFHVGGREGVDINAFTWHPLEVQGRTATAQAINLLCEELDLERMPKRGYAPVCVLVSDGYCTDPEKDYDRAIDRLNSLGWGKKAARIVITIGNDYDDASLRKFVNSRGSYINCQTPEQIIEYVRTATTEATEQRADSTAGAPDGNTSQGSGDSGGAAPNSGSGTADPDDVWM
ncbi:von Willebrand factor type A domain-containing protein [Anaerobacterium chartisolvens]|uniref:von Willebrand factor type A domain-containing protein n=1 Tax=Anaerobacterium chartisolvens TaxID=1297424 RepID=A0A369B4N1_9FIRM|nr:vWA domain-containing protein [Anaerobacterium chartisolvens]RCX15486.1 von Willebrand factor type A domain-containing protein [Anaerobacterium chartisolvens]